MRWRRSTVVDSTAWRMTSSITGILRELETNIIVVPHSHQLKPSSRSQPPEDPQVQELRQELRAAKHENSTSPDH